jgi:NitT/TauT family transport system ATP-binding protein
LEAVFDLAGVALQLPVGKGVFRQILKDVDLSLAAGEVYTIVGASGSGKTSLLRVMGGLARASAGSIRFRGVPVEAPPEGVAFVFQDYANALLQWRTVGRNVALGVERTLSRTDCQQRVAEALRLVGLERHAGDFPWQLSGGMQQRVQLARALATRPSVLLMDEPFAALDAMTKAGLQDELLRLRDQTGASIVFITHDIEEAVYLGDRVALLEGPPGTIARTFTIDLPRQREQIATRESPAFLHFRHALHDAIRHHP